MEMPFIRDPSTTGAFSALRDSEPLVVPDRSLRAVVIGGGTGAPISIQALLSLGFETCAVVAMADDGGSTGILREEANMTPPGDIRKCLAAFASDPNDPLTRAFKYRFEFARNHTLGNLMLSALENATGSFPAAIRICEDILKARGHVYPSTLDRITLCATTRDGRQVRGQANASQSVTALQRVWLEGIQDCAPYMPAVKAIYEADLIVLGPGSLYTSIIPNLLVPGITQAIRESSGKTVFVCSLADMQGETWGMSAREHYEAILEHGMDGLIDFVLVNTDLPEQHNDMLGDGIYSNSNRDRGSEGTVSSSKTGSYSRIRMVSVSEQDIEAIKRSGAIVVARNMVDERKPTWHDPCALREAFAGVVKHVVHL